MADAQQTPHNTSESESGLSFAAFVLSLAHTTAVHLGDVPDPASGQPSPPNLAAAFQMIEILALLEQKTRGNLTAEERQLLDQVLYELRLRFVEVQGAAASSTRETPPARSEETVVPPSGSRTPSGIIIP
jgi:Domain of unknown function (DUF1844)